MVVKHSRDITILIVLATMVYMIVHYSSLFQYFFYWSTIDPTLVVENPDFLYTSNVMNGGPAMLHQKNG